MNNQKTIVWAGDSTVAHNNFYSYPQTGIGQEFTRFVKPEWTLLNLAVNGRSTKSFIDEQRLAKAYFTLHEGDFFFIQFGHNDKKKEDPERYTRPFHEYQENLRKFIAVARNRKATPLLISPLLRLEIDEEGKLINTHEDYPLAMEEVAKAEGVAFVDLTRLSKEFVESIGIEKARAFFMEFPAGQYPNFPDGLKDHTHLRPEGAFVFAKLIAEELARLGSPFDSILQVKE